MKLNYFKLAVVTLSLFVFSVPILIGSDGSIINASFPIELSSFFKKFPGINAISSGSQISNALAVGIGLALMLGLTMGCISFFVDGDTAAAKEKMKHLTTTQRVLFPLVLLLTVVLPWFLEINIPEQRQFSYSFFLQIRTSAVGASIFSLAIFVFSIASIAVFRFIKK